MSSSALLREAEIRRRDLVASLEAMGFPREYCQVAVEHVDPFLTNALPLCLHYMDENPYEVAVPEYLRPKKDAQPEPEPQPQPRKQPKETGETEDDVDAALADKTEMLVKMGFSHTEASLGLVCNDNNIAKTIVWILAQRAMHLEELIAVEKDELDLLTPFGTPGQDYDHSDDDGEGEEEESKAEADADVESRSEAIAEPDDPLADMFPHDKEYSNDMDFVVRDDEVDRWAKEEKEKKPAPPVGVDDSDAVDDANFNEDDYVDADAEDDDAALPQDSAKAKPEVVIDVLSQKYIRSQEEIKMLQTEVQRLQSVIAKYHEHFVSVKSEVRDARRRIIRNARLKGSFKPEDWKKSLRQWRGQKMDTLKQHRSNRIKFYGAQNLNSNNNSPAIRRKSPDSNRSSARNSPARPRAARQELKSEEPLPKSRQTSTSPTNRIVAISAKHPSPGRGKKKSNKSSKSRRAPHQQHWSKVWHTKSWNPYSVAKRPSGHR